MKVARGLVFAVALAAGGAAAFLAVGDGEKQAENAAAPVVPLPIDDRPNAKSGVGMGAAMPGQRLVSTNR